MDDRERWRRAKTSFTQCEEQTQSSRLRVLDFFDWRRSERKEGRLTIRNVRRRADCDVAVRLSTSSACEPFDELAGVDRRWSTAVAMPASRVFTIRFDDGRPSPARRTSLTARRVVTVRVRDLDVWLFESAGRWPAIFCLVELARRPMGLVYFSLNFGRRLVYFSPDGKWTVKSWAAKSCHYSAN